MPDSDFLAALREGDVEFAVVGSTLDPGKHTEIRWPT